MDEPKELTQALAEEIVKASMGFSDNEEDRFLWKWQLRTVEVVRWIAMVKRILGGYEIAPKPQKPTPEEMQERIDDNFFDEEFD